MKYAIITITVLAAVVLQSACGRADSDGVAPINSTAENIAIKGYDTVAYFAANTPIEGNPELTIVWKGAKWLFSSSENLEKFRSNPEKYAPQFGGYCSWAVSHGYTANGDPTAWKIVDGKLYFNYNQKVKEKWEAEQETLIKDGEKNWKEFQTKKPDHKG